MRKFKHKRLNEYTAEDREDGFYIIYKNSKSQDAVAKWIIEESSDWEEIKEELPIGTVLVNDNYPNVIYTKVKKGYWERTEITKSIYEEKNFSSTNWKVKSLEPKFKFGDEVTIGLQGNVYIVQNITNEIAHIKKSAYPHGIIKSPVDMLSRV